MDKPALDPQEADPGPLHALAAQCVNHLSDLKNYFVHYSIEFRLLRRLGIDPLSWRGRLVGGLVVFLVALLPALLLTAVSGQWADAPLLSWTFVAVALGGFSILGLPLYRPAIRNFLSWVWAIADEADLRQLTAWVRRWYSNQVFGPASAVLTLGIVLPLYILALNDVAQPVHAGTLYIGAFIAFIVSQTLCAWVMVVPQARIISTVKHELYRLSPADSVLVRQSLRGYNQTGALNVLLMTSMLLLLLILLPGSSRVVAPAVLILLAVEYLCTAAGTLLPRLLMGRMIQARKEEEMEDLQVQLNALLPRIRELSKEEYEEMTRLQETHDTIRDSPENLLPLGAILRTAGALFLSTVTVLATAFAQEWIAEWAQRFVP